MYGLKTLLVLSHFLLSFIGAIELKCDTVNPLILSNVTCICKRTSESNIDWFFDDTFHSNCVLNSNCLPRYPGYNYSINPTEYLYEIIINLYSYNECKKVSCKDAANRTIERSIVPSSIIFDTTYPTTLTEPASNNENGTISVTTGCISGFSDVKYSWFITGGGSEEEYTPDQRTIINTTDTSNCSNCNTDNNGKRTIGFNHQEASGSGTKNVSFRVILSHVSTNLRLNLTSNNVYSVKVKSDPTLDKWCGKHCTCIIILIVVGICAIYLIVHAIILCCKCKILKEKEGFERCCLFVPIYGLVRIFKKKCKEGCISISKGGQIMPSHIVTTDEQCVLESSTEEQGSALNPDVLRTNGQDLSSIKESDQVLNIKEREQASISDQVLDIKDREKASIKESDQVLDIKEREQASIIESDQVLYKKERKQASIKERKQASKKAKEQVTVSTDNFEADQKRKLEILDIAEKHIDIQWKRFSDENFRSYVLTYAEAEREKTIDYNGKDYIECTLTDLNESTSYNLSLSCVDEFDKVHGQKERHDVQINEPYEDEELHIASDSHKDKKITWRNIHVDDDISPRKFILKYSGVKKEKKISDDEKSYRTYKLRGLNKSTSYVLSLICVDESKHEIKHLKFEPSKCRTRGCPEPPKEVELVKRTGEGVYVKWKPGSDGGFKQTFLLIDAQTDEKLTEPIKCQFKEVEEHFIPIVKRNTDLKLRVMSVNIEGSSESSVVYVPPYRTSTQL